ncbi:INO80 complex subunit 1 [Psilocybe cubensis]|uniref:INO80 complex subunit 1 n=2 Tax=Psilocybe cubensis TaxID=181762 RepID=A0ACB8GI73_PSICU|nr:INO80 complex subunit 1 [Psilocybe cubensis]KAH9475199.1 INO80 complex subunit 1 [Psilocybe cubensis]
MPKGQRRVKNAQPHPDPPPALASRPSPSISTSDSSETEDQPKYSEVHDEDSLGPSASRPGSPSQRAHANDVEMAVDTEDSVTCLWDDCGVVFVHLPTLITHIHEKHIGVHKSNYTCEWTSCVRKGLPQTSRFALISHIRSHTGEKPFICELPECDKSFTRSDALAKHMRLQHNISPPAPGRGGSRKRKRGPDDEHTHGTSTPVAFVYSVSWEAIDDAGNELTQEYLKSRGRLGVNGRQRRQPRPSQLNSQYAPSPEGGEEEDEDSSSSEDILPPHLQEHFDESTGLVLGRTPAKAMYLCMKAKQRFAMEEHEKLVEQLREAKNILKREKEEKEGALDLLLRRMLGPESGMLIPSPPEMSVAASQDSSRHDSIAPGPISATPDYHNGSHYRRQEGPSSARRGWSYAVAKS